jgi:hypothetical protein
MSLITQPMTVAGPVVTPAPRLLTRLGGVCLALAPVVFAAGAVTAPHQDDLTNEGYVASLADHPTQAALSANLLHYSWLFFVFGLIAALALVSGRRGRALTSFSVVAGVISSIQISGLLLLDFFVIQLGQRDGTAETAALQDDLGASVFVWLVSGQLALLFIPLTFFGLARARAISWWIAPLPLVGFIAPAAGLPAALGAVVGLLCWAPAYVAGFQLATGRRRVAKATVSA